MACGAVCTLAGFAVAGGDPARSPAQAGSLTVEFMARSSRVADALAALDRGQSDRAVAHAEAALEEPLARADRLAALNALCVGHVARGAPGAALPFCDRVVRESWGDWRALNNRANARLAVGDLRAAILDYERALDALESRGGDAGVRQLGRAGWQSGRDMLVENLALARRRDAADWQVARIPAPPR